MRKYLFLLVLLFLNQALVGQPLTSTQIDSLVRRSMNAFNVPGIAVAVIKDGRVIHSRGYGVRSLNSGLPTDDQTLFGIASNTKAFTAVALGILVDEGKIGWDDKVRDFIPEFKLYDPYVTEEFTIRDLLTHRSGLGLGAGDLMFFPDSSDFTLNDIIYNLRFLKPVSSFRTKYDYDNNMYILAGEVVARVSGKSWEDFVEERILDPLEMSHSAVSFNRLTDRSNVMDPHIPVNGKLQVVSRYNSDIMNAAGGIYSSVSDLSKWVISLLSGGKYGPDLSKSIISGRVLAEIWSPQTLQSPRNPGAYNTHFRAYGLGFGLSDVKGYKQVTHTGSWPGNVTQVTLIPELQLGIIVLTNQQEGGAFSAITDQIKDSYFGMTRTDRVKQYASASHDAKASADKILADVDKILKANKSSGLKIDMSNYDGIYADPWFGEVVISSKDGQTNFTSRRSPKMSGTMLPYKANTFVVRWNDRSFDADAFVSFTLDQEGKGISFTMKAISLLTDFSFDFQDLNFKIDKP